MANTVSLGGLKVDEALVRLVRDEIAPGTGVEADKFWASLGQIVKDLAPKNRRLLEKRDALQQKIDARCLARRHRPINHEEDKAFLTEIGYLVPEGKDFRATTANVDFEITDLSGPQLVVPLDNARYDRKSTRLNSSHSRASRMPSSA